MRLDLPERKRKRLNRKDKALLVIEGMILATEPGDEFSGAIYKFAHVGLGDCRNPHEDWVKELEKTYRKLVKHRII